jgi:hypothetical protein
MLVLTIISFLIGVILGLRFKVIVLIPAFGLALALIAVSGIVMEEGVWRPVSTTVAVAAFLQLGYICGSILRIAFYRTRVAGHGRVSPSTEASRSGKLPFGTIQSVQNDRAVHHT